MILGVITLIAGVLLTTLPWLDYCILKVSLFYFFYLLYLRPSSGRAFDAREMIKSSMSNVACLIIYSHLVKVF